MSEVFVVDRVTTAAGCARDFIDAYLTGYAPGARERGMTLRDVLVSPPIWFPDRTNVVTITWVLPSPLAWWQMTWQGRPDPTIAQWWDGVGDLIVDRTRSVAGAVEAVEGSPTAGSAPSDAPATSTVGVTRLIDVAESDRDRILTELQAAAARSGATRSVVAPTLPGSRNGGDILVHLRFDDPQAAAGTDFDAALSDPAISRVNGATYRGSAVRSSVGTVYRALLLRVSPEADAATVAEFERELAMMPLYVPTIAAWQLSRVDDAVGTTGWTHVFEQEFTDVDGLMGPYLMHPVHWAVVDRWFDPETTDVIVRDRVCHSFCDLDAPLL
ncbi:Stress responsive A/B Barrel Domain protein [Mycolicibacterium chlorophenolicum]|uniref:Stress responsive A/B Barrel Domain protein n=1 Tax=Mycolicibacterium chlorophenolicum TaxID=37916 RepID=A0A0J6WJI6_9MYCO|nr:Stress responsive A/B Barrel Domain protein [Mycolicibacterium chlorophenolicum]